MIYLLKSFLISQLNLGAGYTVPDSIQFSDIDAEEFELDLGLLKKPETDGPIFLARAMEAAAAFYRRISEFNVTVDKENGFLKVEQKTKLLIVTFSWFPRTPKVIKVSVMKP
ncbi:MAG: hypothetical protein RLY57_35 [Candidatus Parcubacteria bacterium]